MILRLAVNLRVNWSIHFIPKKWKAEISSFGNVENVENSAVGEQVN